MVLYLVFLTVWLLYLTARFPAGLVTQEQFLKLSKRLQLVENAIKMKW